MAIVAGVFEHDAVLAVDDNLHGLVGAIVNGGGGDYAHRRNPSFLPSMMTVAAVLVVAVIDRYDRPSSYFARPMFGPWLRTKPMTLVEEEVEAGVEPLCTRVATAVDAVVAAA